MGGRPNAGVLILLYLWLIAAAAVAVSPGASLSSNLKQSWSSPNGTFSLRFIRAPGGDGSFIAAVTYASIWIWNAGGAGGVVDSGAALQFLTSGNLRLMNGSGSLIWESGTANLGISGADVEDSGELVLRRGTTPVWSSFDHLTDTVVQGQNFTAGQIIRRGLYSFTLESWGNLTLRWNDTIVYWTKGLNSSFDLNLTSPSLRLDPLGIINLYDPQLTSIGTVVAYSSDYGDSVFRFLRLDDDGNLRIHSSARDSRAATERWAAVDDQCKVFAYCGNFGICSYDDVRTICGCPSENFDPVDRSDPRRGCRRKAELDSCPGSTEMLELDSTILLTFSPESSSQVYPAGISGCHFNCLRGMACVASTNLADGMGQCYQKYKASFISGYRSPVFHSTSFLKICGPAMMNPSIGSDAGETRNDSRFPAWIVVFVVSTVLVIDDVLLWWWCRRNPKNASPSMQYALLEYSSGAPVQFTHRELHQSTRGFREKLGEGGFGAVYRGTLANRAAGTHHLNFVRLIGFCSEGKHRLLVYEFMKNGSLDNFIFSESPSSSSVKPAPAVARVLDWECRFRIAIAMARRIMYLHEECSDCIVHCDIKLENILLDKNFNARVSDFGLAKLINPNDHGNRTLKSVRGTRGYLAPEWLTNLLIMSKSDIYSFGMILLEIVSGRRNYEVSPETNQKKFSAWAYGEFERGEVKNIVDRRFGEVDIEQATRMITVGFWCIQEQPSQRPMMGRVLQMLEGITAIDKPPASHFAMLEDSRSMSTSTNTSRLSTLARVERVSSSLSLSEELQ